MSSKPLSCLILMSLSCRRSFYSCVVLLTLGTVIPNLAIGENSANGSPVGQVPPSCLTCGLFSNIRGQESSAELSAEVSSQHRAPRVFLYPQIFGLSPMAYK